MKSPWLIYTLIRLGIFGVALVLLLLLGFPEFLAALFAAVISLAISLLFLSKQRDAVSRYLYNKRNNVESDETKSEDRD